MAIVSSHLLSSTDGSHASGVRVIINQIKKNGKRNKIYQCKNCGCGFKSRENKSDSCKKHPLGYGQNGRYYCCGASNTVHNSWCLVGYHIPK